MGTEEGGQFIIATTEAFSRFKGEYENTTYFKRHKPASVAVLPFVGVEDKAYSIAYSKENPGDIVRRGMYNHIASLPFKDLELFNADKRLKNAGITDTGKIDQLLAENPKKLKSILGVDAVFTGKITHFDRIYAGIYSQLAVGCEVKLWDLKTGNLLWRAKHVQRTHGGGFSLNPIGLITATIASVWNLRHTEMMSQTDDLFREIVSTIELPESALHAQVRIPRIDLFTVMNPGKPFVKGKKVAFRLIGDPGCRAYVDLGDFQAGIELAPVSGAMKKVLQLEVLDAIRKTYTETGHRLTDDLLAGIEKEFDSREIYEGTYTVKPDEQAYGLTAMAYLVNSDSGQGRAIDPAHQLDIDSLPPEMVSGLATDSLDGKVKVLWMPNREDDLAGYEIWSSTTPLSGFTQAASSEKQTILLPDQENFNRFFVRVRAVDRAGNSGKFPPAAEAVALPVAGLYELPQPGPMLGGAIMDKVLLVAEKNPYTAGSGITVGPGATLYIEPGVEILFAPGAGLTIAGGEMLAYGHKDRPVIFGPKANNAQPGAWPGVVLDGAERVRLKYITIAKADTGLTVSNCAPEIQASTISQSAQAGMVLMDNARPNVSCSVFSGNQGQGALVMEGAGLGPIIHNNIFEDSDPFHVQSYAPLQVDLTGNFWGTASPAAELFLGNILWKPALADRPDACVMH
ncbi:MAG: hypothetical protein GY697_24000 [Desulfobacterales bacterium]|nr:hypothetical protein [Desulfobacterales bacterium]